MYSDTRGFTLFELIIVIVVISTLAFMSVGVTVNALKKNQIFVETDQIANILRVAQSRSISGTQDDVWGVHLTGTTYTLFRGATYATRDPTYDELHALPAGIVASGLVDIIFEFRTGKTSNTGTITITDVENGTTRTLTINNNGRITDL